MFRRGRNFLLVHIVEYKLDVRENIEYNKRPIGTVKKKGLIRYSFPQTHGSLVDSFIFIITRELKDLTFCLTVPVNRRHASRSWESEKTIFVENANTGGKKKSISHSFFYSYFNYTFVLICSQISPVFFLSFPWSRNYGFLSTLAFLVGEQKKHRTDSFCYLFSYIICIFFVFTFSFCWRI